MPQFFNAVLKPVWVSERYLYLHKSTGKRVVDTRRQDREVCRVNVDSWPERSQQTMRETAVVRCCRSRRLLQTACHQAAQPSGAASAGDHIRHAR